MNPISPSVAGDIAGSVALFSLVLIVWNYDLLSSLGKICCYLLNISAMFSVISPRLSLYIVFGLHLGCSSSDISVRDVMSILVMWLECRCLATEVDCSNPGISMLCP